MRYVLGEHGDRADKHTLGTVRRIDHVLGVVLGEWRNDLDAR